MRLENRHADFCGPRRGGRSILRKSQRGASECEKHRRSDAPKSDRALGQMDFQWWTDGNRGDSNTLSHSSRGEFKNCRGWGGCGCSLVEVSQIFFIAL